VVIHCCDQDRQDGHIVLVGDTREAVALNVTAGAPLPRIRLALARNGARSRVKSELFQMSSSR
jgi:hypothetical protein